MPAVPAPTVSQLHSMSLASFYILAALVLYSAYFVVTARNLFRCAVGLISALLGIAGLYLLIDAQFLSAIQVTVYIGGIVVLIVFVILLVTDVTQKVFQQSSAWRKGAVAAVSCLLFGLLATMLHSHDFHPVAATDAKSASVEQIGRALLSPERGGFVLPFEVISLVLIAALIGAVTVARTDTENSQRQQTPGPTVAEEPPADELELSEFANPANSRNGNGVTVGAEESA